MTNFFEQLELTFLDFYESAVDKVPALLLGILALVLFWAIASRMRTFSRKRLIDRMDDDLLADFISRLLKYLFIVIGCIVALNIIGLGTVAAGVFTGAGVSAIVVGFAFKDIGENFLAGIMLAFKRPFKVGDLVELNNQKGVVVHLNIRDTQIKTFDGIDIFIPNAQIVKNAVKNYTIDGFLRLDFSIGIDQENDPVEAARIATETINTVEGVLNGTKNSFTTISNVTPSGTSITTHFWIDTIDSPIPSYVVKNNGIKKVLDALIANGFYMPADVIELKGYRGQSLNIGKASE